MINSVNNNNVDLNLPINNVFLNHSNIVPLNKINMEQQHATKSTVVATTANANNNCNWSFNGRMDITGIQGNAVDDNKPYVNNHQNIQSHHHITAENTKDIIGNIPYHQMIETKKRALFNKTNNNNNNNIFICKESALKIEHELSTHHHHHTAKSNSLIINKSPRIDTTTNWPHATQQQLDDMRKIPNTTIIKRTECHENAYRRIEEVHNYAKLEGGGSYSNESSNSSSIMHDDDDNDDDDEEDMEYDEDITANYERYVDQYERHVNNWQQEASYKHQIEIEQRREIALANRAAKEQQQQQQQQDEKQQNALNTPPPDHHARRPMNAFLIFCKRHRAIVKERYKSLENRAITKILGDWWASLDDNDKKCFTNLAQQNKDAFFSANPNFKWYKLPAPPLRTLNTRPSNADNRTTEQDFEVFHKLATQNIHIGQHARKNYFKLADETAMGGLNTLMNNKQNNNNLTNQNALQQALGETTQFLSAYMPQNANDINNISSNSLSKRRLHSEHSFSSNSSEEDVLPKKSTRSCKGKIYQELINSGQISAIQKKLKPNKITMPTTTTTTTTPTPCSIDYTRNEIELKNSFLAGETSQRLLPTEQNNIEQTSSLSRSFHQQHCELTHFDLEERIKELPALSLDLYLQRKRNTKKKKKFTTKKRNSNSVSSNRSTSSVSTLSPTETTPMSVRCERPAPPAAVGSQKRKARKESITRRDLSAIENEIASIIPLPTINGCYIFNESIVNRTTTTMRMDDNEANVNGNVNAANVENNNSSTSDLLILAEVAANRTELTN